MPRVAARETVLLLGRGRPFYCVAPGVAQSIAQSIAQGPAQGIAQGSATQGLANDVVRELVAQTSERRVVVVSTAAGGGDRTIDPSSPSCARGLCDLLLELRPTTLALLAFSESPVTPVEPWNADAALAGAVTSALDRCVELGGHPPALLMLSTTSVYGVAQGSPLVFDEQSRLPRETVFASSQARWAQGMRDVERQIVAWAVGAGVRVGVLRAASVLGGPMDGPVSVLLRAPFPVRVLGYDPPCQVVHYDDLVRAIALAIDQGCGEVLNIVGRSVVPLSRLLAMAGVFAAPLPGPLADRMAPAGTDGAHLRWRTLADGRRATALLGFRPERTLEQTLQQTSRQTLQQTLQQTLEGRLRA